MRNPQNLISKHKRFKLKRPQNIKKAFLILSLIAIISLGFTVASEVYFKDNPLARVYRTEHLISLDEVAPPTIDIITAGMRVELSLWDGDEIRIRPVSELPLMIVKEHEYGYTHEISINQDDGFAISFFTLQQFRYNLQICLPRNREYRQINITTVGGNVTINAHHLRVREPVRIITDGGDVNISRSVTEFTIRTRSGNINMDFDSLVANTMINTESGDINLKVSPIDLRIGRVEELVMAFSKNGEISVIANERIPLV